MNYLPVVLPAQLYKYGDSDTLWSVLDIKEDIVIYADLSSPYTSINTYEMNIDEFVSIFYLIE